ncbi:hypothetical protein CLAFUW4_06176 [Fulvia fulva]|uniref:Vps72/YL1 C-terminal domain-containing protein n=1 Tax=Passalora fulva TaxID=5499 RepID=A0A9Q8P9N3_PASFU|nr:uncharacterized protein CLAFUR5_06320 [Fulvia fulva]KAK4623894.1 hypothetical protein CLAFUR4_06179 [Fulvia fulva]KAK4625713.1 hypothetical protein CLAFUR0_06183 [Fulvia fulva]UJO18343.1 hypothetical protein CLAFUR5_06320 [Fulvia fulva]WPV14648.1 hypothetical protein CLAFUW4_06176 [Fulvia fulva]WPV30408.1 hypothetical protein CLAFUW7_06172 [Fulvia fulva]
MSDDGRSDSSSEGEDLTTTGLIATRAKRATAGNLYATLRANLDDEELQKELLAEDEDDQGEYEASDKDDDDAAMESSSDEEDAGPPKEGDKEDLEGEKALKRAERAEAKKKRKMEEAKMRVPAFARAKKRVKLADDVKADDGSAPKKPKKKSERSDWRPTGADAPIRQSSRAAAVANREVVHANLKESLVRSEKQKKVMANHHAREQFKKRMELSQEERLAKTARIEKETAREFGRWEREEAERQRLRDEALAAKRNRGLDGPVIKYWSGSVLWEGDKIKRKRLHGSINVDDISDEPTKTGEASSINGNELNNALANFTAGKLTDTAPTSMSGSGPGTPGLTAPKNVAPAVTEAPSQPASQQQAQAIQAPPQAHWLDGIEQYASDQPEAVLTATLAQTAPMPLQPNPYTPSAPSINAAPVQHPPLQPISPYPPPAAAQNDPLHPSTTQSYHAWPSGFQGSNTNRPQLPYATAPPPPPLPKEQARRSLIILEQFEHLELSTVGRRSTSKASKDATTDPTPVASTLLPESYPTLTPDETRYLVNKKWKKEFPPAPEKTKCALTAWPAKFRDPKTGLPYADLQQYKMIQRLLMGGCQWSSFLGAWVGPSYGDTGRPAKGVPDGFGVPIEEAVVRQGSVGDTKMEDV